MPVLSRVLVASVVAAFIAIVVIMLVIANGSVIAMMMIVPFTTSIQARTILIAVVHLVAMVAFTRAI